MGYNDGEALVLARVRDNSNFDSNNTSRHKWGILDKGKKRFYAVLKNGGGVPEFITPTVYAMHWNTIIQVWERMKPGATPTQQTLAGHVEDIIGQLQADKQLGDTSGLVQNSEVVEVREQEVWERKNATFMMQEIVLEWIGQNKVTYD